MEMKQIFEKIGVEKRLAKVNDEIDRVEVLINLQTTANETQSKPEQKVN